MKNPDLCQLAKCEQPFTKTVRGRNFNRIWTRRVCDEHARFYEQVLERATTNHTRLPLTITKREL